MGLKPHEVLNPIHPKINFFKKYSKRSLGAGYCAGAQLLRNESHALAVLEGGCLGRGWFVFITKEQSHGDHESYEMNIWKQPLFNTLRNPLIETIPCQCSDAPLAPRLTRHEDKFQEQGCNMQSWEACWIPWSKALRARTVNAPLLIGPAVILFISRDTCSRNV